MFTYHTEETAPEASRPLMEDSQAVFGMLPNMHRILAEAPATYKAHNTAYKLFTRETDFTPLEAQVVYMAANYVNRCHYCMAGHSWGMTMMKMPADVIEDLRQGRPLNDPRLQALRQFVEDLLDYRGHIGDDRLKAFLDAGYSKKQALEVLCGLSVKIIANFTNALAHTEVEDKLAAHVWTPPEG